MKILSTTTFRSINGQLAVDEFLSDCPTLHSLVDTDNQKDISINVKIETRHCSIVSILILSIERRRRRGEGHHFLCFFYMDQRDKSKKTNNTISIIQSRLRCSRFFALIFWRWQTGVYLLFVFLLLSPLQMRHWRRQLFSQRHQRDSSKAKSRTEERTADPVEYRFSLFSFPAEVLESVRCDWRKHDDSK